MKLQYITAILILVSSKWLTACVPPPVIPPTATLQEEQQPPTTTSTNSPSPTPLPSDTPTPTPLPRPVVEIFPQAVDGRVFLFPEDQPNLIKGGIIEDQVCRRSGAYGVQLTYNFSTFGGGWGIHWGEAPLKHFNATGYTNLAFWVKGAAGNEKFQIGLKDTGLIDVPDDQNEVKVNSTEYQIVSGSEWREVVVPLNHFTGNQGQVNIASIDNVTFTFEAKHGSGSICIDDIAYK